MMSKNREEELLLRCAALEGIIRDIHWMARRYADGRSTYAAHLFNTAIRTALSMGIALEGGADKLVFARDSMGRAYDGLSEAEANPPGARGEVSWVVEDIRRLRTQNLALVEALLATTDILAQSPSVGEEELQLVEAYRALARRASAISTPPIESNPPVRGEKSASKRGM